jgi:predicted nucleic acid-binding protein
VIVADATVVAAAVLDTADVGPRARAALASAGRVAAPHHMPAETANILRRAEAHRSVSPDVAALAHAELLDLRLDLYPYRPLAQHAWELRANVPVYDGWYVALAESLAVPLVTLDPRPRNRRALRGRRRVAD